MMRRWIIRGLALTLLTLCVVAWVGSYFETVTWTYLGPVHYIGIGVDSGLVEFLDVMPHPIPATMTPKTGWDWAYHLPSNPRILKADHSLLGFGYEAPPGAAPGWAVWIPMWFPTVLSALLLWLVWRKTRPAYNGRGFPVESPGKEATKP
jgi:hypothetical protein